MQAAAPPAFAAAPGGRKSGSPFEELMTDDPQRRGRANVEPPHAIRGTNARLFVEKRRQPDVVGLHLQVRITL
eukprot:2468578-Prorocentrum_lima.AAC.1